MNNLYKTLYFINTRTVTTVRHTSSSQEDEHQSGADHPYYQTIVKCTPKLVTALSGSPLPIADQLLAKGFMSREVYRSLLVPSLTPDKTAREMGGYCERHCSTEF